METVGIVVGIVLGLFGSVFSVGQFFYQKKRDAALDALQELKDKQQELKDKQQDIKDKQQELKDRLYFLANLIVDKDIPRESRQPFYDEYIAKGGNGSFVKFWLEEKNSGGSGKEVSVK